MPPALSFPVYIICPIKDFFFTTIGTYLLRSLFINIVVYSNTEFISDKTTALAA